MHLLKTIFFIIFGMILIGCGGGSDNEGAVKVARVEDGVPKTEDGRIILSSESENLTIPLGKLEGIRIDSTKLANEIVQRAESVSKVYDFSVTANTYQRYFSSWLEVSHRRREFLYRMYPDGAFSLSFSVETVSSEIYEDIECSRTHINTRRWREPFPGDERFERSAHKLCVLHCGNDQVTLDLKTWDNSCIDMKEIVADVDKGYRDPKRKDLN